MSKVMQISGSAGAAGITAAKTSFKAADKNNVSENTEKSGIDKTFVYSAAAALGLAAIAGWMLLRGKGEKAQETAQAAGEKLHETAENLQAGVKKFFSAEGGEIEGVTLKKGLALNADGSAFTGMMTTVNGKGNVSIKYENGSIQSSIVNDKLYSKFYYGANGQDRHIIKYNDSCEPIQHTLQYFSEDGKLSRVYVHNGADFEKGTARAIDYAPDGSRLSHTEYTVTDDKKHLITIFDKDNNITREFELGHHDLYGNEIIRQQDGSKIVKKGYMTFNPKKDLIGTPASELGFSAQSANLIDADGAVKMNIVTFRRDTFDINTAEGGYIQVQQLGGEKNGRLSISAGIDKETDLPDFSIFDDGTVKFRNNQAEEVTKEQMQKLLGILEEGQALSAKAGSPNLAIPQEKLDALKAYVEKMPETPQSAGGERLSAVQSEKAMANAAAAEQTEYENLCQEFNVSRQYIYRNEHLYLLQKLKQAKEAALKASGSNQEQITLGEEVLKRYKRLCERFGMPECAADRSIKKHLRLMEDAEYYETSALKMVLQRKLNKIMQQDSNRMQSISELAASYGMKPADKTVNISGINVHIIYEGETLDIDEHGRLLQKVLSPSYADFLRRQNQPLPIYGNLEEVFPGLAAQTNTQAVRQAAQFVHA